MTGVPTRSSRRTAAAFAVVALVAAGCARKGITRAEVVTRYRTELVAEGVREPQARCLTDRFFGELTDAQLKAFQERDRLTDAEKQRFAELAEVCADAG